MGSGHRVVPLESALEGSLEGSRGDRALVPNDTPGNDHAIRVTPLSGTQLFGGDPHAGIVGSTLVLDAQDPFQLHVDTRRFTRLAAGRVGKRFPRLRMSCRQVPQLPVFSFVHQHKAPAKSNQPSYAFTARRDVGPLKPGRAGLGACRALNR